MTISVPVLTYHHINPHAGDIVTVTPEVFAAQMGYLADSGFTTLSIDELMKFLSSGEKICNKAVVVTFDDGWLDNYLYAVPVLKKLKFKASFFIITGRVDAASSGAAKNLSYVPTHEEAKACIQSSEAVRVVFDWDLVRSVGEDRLFSFYSHTVSHRRCAELARADLMNELAQSKWRVENELGRPCPYLCWPYGSFTDDTIKAAVECGYTGIFTTVDGFCDPATDPLSIMRIDVKNSVEWIRERLENI
jgi:peptidoglycan/xylan/chitin deacetylase (PgdA/CDA1 family)